LGGAARESSLPLDVPAAQRREQRQLPRDAPPDARPRDARPTGRAQRAPARVRDAARLARGREADRRAGGADELRADLVLAAVARRGNRCVDRRAVPAAAPLALVAAPSARGLANRR